VPQDKATRVYNRHRNTLHALAELIGAAGLRHPGEIEPRHIVRRVSSNEIRLVANLYKFLKPGELLTNPKAHVVYEYYWPLATSKSFDPQPGNDAHIVVGREHALKKLRKEGMRAQAGTQIFRLLLHGWHVSRSIVRTAAACILSSYCAQELAAFLQSLAAHASSLFPSGRCRRRPHAGELNRARKGPVLFGECTIRSLPRKTELRSLNSARGPWP
jgi:hypothetical protein